MTTAALDRREHADPAAEPASTRRPRAELICLALLLAGTATLYFWNLGSNGYSNDYYAAAVQAGAQSWKAWLFGSLDIGNVVTVDKPPAALWLMGLSARIFGFSSWSMLAPQALCGVASVALLYAAVRRSAGPVAGLLAGAAFALTPVAALMFRFNNPDALLVLLLIAAAYCMVRAIERAGMRWVLLAGALIGFAFLTKMLQAFLVLPAFGLVYLVAAPTTIWRRVGHLAAGLGALVLSAGWWIALVELWPASARPYIGGSEGNSALELALGYNGLSRLFGGGSGGAPGGGVPGGAARVAAPPPGGGGPGGSNAFGGETGIGRLFSDAMSAEISWLLPAALIGLVAGLWFTRRAPRTDRTRAALLLWGGWLLVTGLVFSFMQGVIHPYYTVALAPAIAALAAIAGRALWRGRQHPVSCAGNRAAQSAVQAAPGRVVVAGSAATTSSFALPCIHLDPRTYAANFRRGTLAARATLAAMVQASGVWALVLLLGVNWAVWLGWVALGLSLLVSTWLLAGPHRAAARFGRMATAFGLVAVLSVGAGSAAYAVGTVSVPHVGTLPSSGPVAAAGIGGPGGQTASAELVAALRATSTKWAAASVGAQGASTLQLASGRPVLGVGGFSGGDPAPTLAEFQRSVADGEIRYFLGAGQGGFGGMPARSDGAAGQIARWVQQNFTSSTIGGQTVYDLTT